VKLPYRQVIVGSGDPITEENQVEFHLLYSGELHVDGDRKEKHGIRKAFHPQLRRLWLTDRLLRMKARNAGAGAYVDSDEDVIPRGFAAMGSNWNRNGFNFVPLVTSGVVSRCSLDILFLRVEEKNYILQGGDIDGRIKTLFDGLRMIRDANELPRGTKPEEDEKPFFCLLEDDKLISEASSADRRRCGPRLLRSHRRRLVVPLQPKGRSQNHRLGLIYSGETSMALMRG